VQVKASGTVRDFFTDDVTRNVINTPGIGAIG